MLQLNVLWFLLGLALGSFCLVVIMRYPKGGLKAALTGRSRCDSCKHQLELPDLVPLLSFIIYRGKCRWCGARQTYVYPFFELFLAVVAVLLSYSSYTQIETLLNLTIIAIMVIIAGIDWLTMEIDEKLIYGGLAIVLLEIIVSRSLVLPHIYGLIIGSGLFLILVAIGRGKWMGAGDIMVGGLIGFWLGYPLVLIALPMSFISGAIYGGLLLAAKKATLKTAVPFAPFIILGATLTLLYGSHVLKWIIGGR